MKNVLKFHVHKLDPIDVEGVMLFNRPTAVNWHKTQVLDLMDPGVMQLKLNSFAQGQLYLTLPRRGATSWSFLKL